MNVLETRTAGCFLVAFAAACANAPTTLSGPSAANGSAAAATGTSAHGAATAGAGGSGSGSGTGGAQASFGVSLDNAAPAVDLASEVDVTVTVSPAGYVGMINLSENGLTTAGVAASFTPATLTVDGTTKATSTLALKTGSATVSKMVPFTVDAFSPGGTGTTTATLDVRAAITITIPANANQLGGTQANPYKTAFGPYPIPITAPAGLSMQNTLTVRFFNKDTVAHEIHASQPNQGFAHDPGPIAPNTMDAFVRNVNATGTYDFYLHDQNQPITIGRIVVQ